MGVTSVPALRVCPVTVLGRGKHRNAKEGRGQLKPQRTRGASQVCLFFWAKLLNNCKPQNTEFFVYSYGIFYHVVVFMTNLNAGVLLWCQEPFLFRNQAHSLLHCCYFFCLGRVCSHAHVQSFELKLWRCKARGCWGGLWIAHGQMGLSRSYVWRWQKTNAGFVILLVPHVGPCSSQLLAPIPPASTGWVCSCCPGRKATATPSPSMAFWTGSPTYIFWSELSCRHYLPMMRGEHWGIVSACTEAAALCGHGLRLCRSCSGLTACSTHSHECLQRCRGFFLTPSITHSLCSVQQEPTATFLECDCHWHLHHFHVYKDDTALNSLTLLVLRTSSAVTPFMGKPKCFQTLTLR